MNSEARKHSIHSDPLLCFIFFDSFSDAQVHHPPDPQRYLSDSEVELKQCQESLTRESEIRWAWGKLPQVSHQHCISLRKQLTLDYATIVFAVKRRLRNEQRNSILMMEHYTDLGSTSDLSL